jgi:hypothetical protein
VVCWAVVGIAVEDGSSWSMDMLGHSGGTLYKVSLLFLFQSGEAVELFREKPKGCSWCYQNERTGVTTSFARARAEHVRNVVSTRCAAHVKASGRSAFITHHALHTHFCSKPWPNIGLSIRVIDRPRIQIAPVAAFLNTRKAVLWGSKILSASSATMAVRETRSDDTS